MKHSLYQQAMAAAGWLLLLLLCVACSDEGGNNGPEIPEIQYARVTISLGTADNATPAFTKAGEETTLPDIDDELYEREISDWWIVILDRQKNVYDVLSSELNDNWVATSNTADNEHEVGVDLVIGESYSFYAFANLKGLSNNDAVTYLSSLHKGMDLEVSKAVELKEITAYGAEEESPVYIPMSSYPSDPITVKENNNKVELLLIRLLGKVSVEVNNASGQDMKLNKVTLSSFRSGSIYLLPYDAAESKNTKNLLATNMESTLAPSFPTTATSTFFSDRTLFENGITLKGSGEEATTTASIYANETLFTSQTGENASKDLLITLDVEGRNNDPISTNFSFIRRNDWLKIPITISNAEVQVTPKQMHMPIGGIPAPLTFKPGAILAVQDYYVDHAGEITFDYELTKLNAADAAGWTLKYYNSGDEYESKDRFCCVQIVENGANGKPGLILEPAEEDANYVELPWLSTSSTKAWGFKMTPAKVTGEAAGTETESTTKGSFTIRLQELVPNANTSTARIKLTLVATNGTTTVILPYYINIKFGSQPAAGEGA